MGIFKIEDDLLVLEADYIRGIPEYRKLLERDKGSKGDVDGRKKKHAWKEFFYIYMFCDFKSYPNKGGFNDKEKHLASIKEAGLEDNYKPDVDVKLAMDKYLAIHAAESTVASTISTTIKGLRVADKISQSIIDNIERTLELIQASAKRKAENSEPNNVANDLLETQGLVQQLNQLMSISTNLPKTVSTLEQLQIKLLKEESTSNVARGGQAIGRRADPV